MERSIWASMLLPKTESPYTCLTVYLEEHS